MNYKDYLHIDSYIANYKLHYGKFDLTKLLRDELIYQIREKKGEGTKKVKITSNLLIVLLFNLFSTFPKMFYKKKYWVFSNADRRKLVDNYYLDRVASIVSEIYPNETLFVESSILTRHKKPTKDFIISESLFQLFGFLISKIIFKRKNINYKGDITEIENFFSVNLNLTPAIQKFLAQYYSIKIFLWLKRKPKAIFIVYPNGYYGYTYRFREKNIPVIELQHGIIYREHPSYNNSSKSSNKLKPDYIFTYGIKDKDCLKQINFLTENNIFSVGSYMLSLQQRQNAKSNYLNNILERIHKNKKIVAVSATIKDVDHMFEWAKQIVMSYVDVYILFMPRAKYKPDKYDTKSISVLDIDKTNIYEIIKACDIHVTQSSTCSLEALYFNKKSLIYEKEAGCSMFRRNYRDTNLLSYFTSTEEFYELLSSPIDFNKNNIDLLFEANVVDNFRNSINTILNNVKV